MLNKFVANNKSVYPIIFKGNFGMLESINCYLYEHNDFLTLIDAGINTREFQDYFEEQLTSYGFEIMDIDQIILTHHHSDHIGLVNYIVKQKSIPVYAHHLAIPRLLLKAEYQIQKIDFFSQLYTRYGCMELAESRLKKIKKTMDNSQLYRVNTDVLPLYEGIELGDLKIIEAPGHSIDSIMLYDEDAKWLFVGDVLIKQGSTNALIDHDEKGSLIPSVLQHKTSIEKCLKLNANYIFPGHHQIYSTIHEVVEYNISRINYKLDRLVAKIEEGNNSVTKLVHSIYGKRVDKEAALILSEVIGYLYYAEILLLIKPILKNGCLSFEKNVN